ncbi:hypothetical protein BKA82DRAFT_369851 [Pisolithus tinctorius]|uniref:Uncharacterized protein n=1 Tax=Pisolithus tinctorius Marx 270 TaxID=870435 RepID=A0A0C3NGE5_PISTI|nr:hypothetical protein BKA82DRAFT_369851 [Pisolithus tinctorius]KIN94810.1 hypothetical protein M404DRAFT_369851 [Pisolithus tinctorius Marx 270]
MSRLNFWVHQETPQFPNIADRNNCGISTGALFFVDLSAFVNMARSVFPPVFNTALLTFIATDHFPTTGAGLLALINNYVTTVCMWQA